MAEKEQECGRCIGGVVRVGSEAVTCPRCHGAGVVPVSWNDPSDQQDRDKDRRR